MLRRWLWLAVPLAMFADEAAACSPDPCAGVVAFTGLDPTSDVEVPIDGVLVMQANWFGTIAQDAVLDALALTVTHAGAAVAGAVEPTELTGVLLWRPDAPLLPGAQYVVSGFFSNGSDVPSVCAAAAVDFAFVFTAALEPAEPLTVPELHGSIEVTESALFDLDTIACCDDAIPAEQVFCGVSHGLAWSKGQCASMLTRTRLKVDLRATTDVDEVTAAQWVHTLFQDGEEVRTSLGARFTRHLTEPACFTVERRSLATGETLASEAEACFGQGIGVPLGDLPLDPGAALAGACVDDLYTCEVDDDGWDRDACTPYIPPEIPTVELLPGACSCAGGDPHGGLGLLGLLALRRRRRA